MWIFLPVLLSSLRIRMLTVWLLVLRAVRDLERSGDLE
jgi:hypothetical protein